MMNIPYQPDLTMPLKEFLCATTCPDAWLCFDIYTFYEHEFEADDVFFYVGQSDCAYGRVWQHIQNGFKGRSDVGKFVRVNWPRSMNFGLALFDSRGEQFTDVIHDPIMGEKVLIQALRPCFNEVHNYEPTPIPTGYLAPTETVRYPRHMGRMLREAEAACRVKQGDDVW